MALAVFLLLFASNLVYSNVVITPATGAANLCIGGGYVPFGDITIAEGLKDDFRVGFNQTLVFAFPANFEFNPTSGTITAVTGSDGLVINWVSYSLATRRITINYNVSNQGGSFDKLILKDAYVRAVGVPGSGQLVRDPSSTANIIGDNNGDGVNHASFSSSYYPTALNLISSDADNNICTGETVTFTASATSTNAYEFFVDGVSVQNSTSNAYTTSTLTNGQKVTFRAYNSGGCTDGSLFTTGITTTVNPKPTVSLASSDANNIICAGETVTFTAISATAANYEFFIDAASVQSGPSNTFTTSTLSDGQSVTVKVTDTNGCTTIGGNITTTVHPLPSVSLTSSDANNIICIGETITFTATSATAVSYEFFVGSTSVQNGASTIFTTNSLADGQTVTVIATSADGCSIVSNPITTVVENVLVNLTSNDADNKICTGDEVTFTVTSNIAINYEFFVDGVSVQNSAAADYTATLTNGQTVTVKATSANGCAATSNAISTVVNPVPTVTLKSSDTDNKICVGDVVTFTATSATAVSYEFFVGATLVQSGPSNKYITNSLVDDKTVSVKAINAYGCQTFSLGITTTVYTVAVSLSGSDADNSICPGDALTFTASSATATSYEFFVDGVSVQNSAATTFTTTSLTDGQTVMVKAGINGCAAISNSISTAVKVLTASITSSDADNMICLGEALTFTASANIAAASYEFFVDGLSVQNSTSNTYTTSGLTNSQTVMVKAVTASGCSATSSGITTIVNPLPTVSLTSSDADNKICTGETLTFTANAAGAVSYDFFVDGVSVQNSAAADYTATLTNGQMVTVKATSANGCAATSNAIITLIENITVSLTSSDADNKICVGDVVTFTATSPTAVSYEFFVGATLVQSGASNKYITNSLVDDKTVSVKAINAYGCQTFSLGITTTVYTVAVSLSGSDADNSICPGDALTFTASSATATSYEFFVDGVSVQNSAATTFTTTSLTDGQTVTVIAADTYGCTATSNAVKINVVSLTTSLASSDADNMICLGEALTFTASANIAAASYEFFVDGLSVQNSTSSTYTTSGLTNGQTVRVTAVTASGCSANSSGITTIVNPLPTVSLTSSDADNKICAGETLTFTANAAGAVNYEFFVGTTSVQNGATNQYTTAALADGQTVTVKATNFNGCTAASNSITTAVYFVTVSLTSSDADDQICAGEAVTFTATSATASSYDFFVGATSVQNGPSNTYTTSSLADGQTVTVKATVANICTATSNAVTTTVYAVAINLTSSDADNTICPGDAITFTSSLAGSGANYEFFVDGASVQNSASNTFTTTSLIDGQMVMVKATNSYGCIASSNAVTTAVKVLAANLISSDTDNTICAGESVTYTANAPTATSYEFFIDGVSVQNSATNIFTTTTLTDNQVVYVKATTASGCSALSNSITVTVHPLPLITLTSSDADNAICAGETITFTATSSTATIYEFFVDGVSKQNGASNSYSTNTLINGQIVTVKAATSDGCTATSNSISTTVYAITVNLTSSDSDNKICIGETVTFTASSNIAATYEFFVGAVSVQNGSSNTFTTSIVEDGKTVTVKATSPYGCSITSAGITTTAYTVAVTLTSNDPDNITCPGDAVTFTATSATATSYEFLVNGVSKQNSASKTFTTSTLTNGQTVIVKASNSYGCFAVSSGITQQVKVLVASLISSDSDNRICAGETITFTANAATATNFEFIVGSTSVQNGASNTFTTSTLTDGQTVAVKATTDNGCAATSNAITTIVETVTVTLTSSDADNKICAGETVTFIASSPTATNYEFFVDGILRQKSATNIFTTSTLTDGQTVSLKAINAYGCFATSSTITHTVHAVPTVSLASSDSDNTICAGESLIFTATSDIATVYEFFVDGVSQQVSASNTFINNTLTNNQIVTVRASTSNGCGTVSNAIATTVNAIPTITLTSSDADNQICTGETVTFAAASSTATTYEFFVDGISAQNSATNIFTTNALLNGQTVTVRVTTPGACSEMSAGITTTVNALPTVTLTSSDADNTICAGDIITFTASSATATNYKFYIGASLVQDGASPSYTTSSLTNGQTVMVRVTTASGCSTTSSGITTTVNPLPTVTLTSSDSDNKICAGETLTFTATSSTATGYEFIVAGIIVQSGASNQYTTASLTDGQTVTVRVSTANNCSTTSLGITTTVNPLPAVTLTSSDADNTICSGDIVTFTANASIPSTYEFFVDGISAQNSTSNIFATNSLTNNQKVVVIITTVNGCFAVSSGITTTVNPLPTVTLTSSDADNTICSGDIVTFTASSSTATNYKFYIGASLVQDGASPSYTTSSLTNGQTVTVRVTTANGCSTTSSGITTTVNPLPAVSLASSDADNKICAGESVTFTATSATATSYEFIVAGIIVQSGVSNKYTTSALTDGQTVTVRVTTANGCSTTSSGITTTVNPLPTVTLTSIDADNIICAGDIVTFTADADIASNYEFFVDGTSKQKSATNIFTTSTLTNGQTVTVRVTTANGCSTTSSGITTTVNPLPTVTLTSSDSDNKICVGETLTFTATSATATSYEFIVAGIIVQSGASNKYTTSALTDGQTVTVRVTTSSSCFATSSGITTTVNPLPIVSLASSDADNKICTGETLTFTASSATATNYKFYIGASLVQDGASPSYTTSSLTNGQTVTVRVTTASGCSTTSSGITTTVNPLPTVTLTSSDSDNKICVGETLTFTATSATATSYEFIVAGIIVQSGASDQYTTASLLDGQTVMVRVNTSDGCSATSSGITTTVNPLPIVTLTSSDSDNTICTGETLTFTASSATATNYKFYIGASLVQDGASPSYTTSSLTNGQTVTVRVTTASGCSTTSSGITTTVNPLPTVTLTSSVADNTICAGEPVTFTANSDIASNYEFFVNGVSKQKGPSNQYTTSVLTNGQIISALVTSANGCSKASSGITIIVNPISTVNAGTDRTVCVNASVSLSGSIGGAATSGTWSGGKGTFSNVNDLKASYTPDPSEAGKIIVLILTTNDADGTGPCSAVTDEVIITVYALPIVDFSGLAAQYCVDAAAVSLTGFPAGGVFTGKGISGNSFNPSIAGVGTHTIRYIYSDGNGCVNLQQKTVIVHALPSVSFSGFNNIGAGGTALYSYGAAPIKLTGFPAGGVFTGKGISGNTFIPAQAGQGTYQVIYSYSDTNGCENLQIQTVTVEPLPTVGIGEVGGPYCTSEEDVVLVGSPLGGYFTGDGIVTGTNIFRPSIAKTGANVVRYNYTDALGGTNYIEKSITVNALPSVTFIIAKAYCIDAGDILLTGFPADNDGAGGVTGTFSGPGIVAGSSTFRPSLAGIGSHVIRYTFTNLNGCSSFAEKTVVVNELPVVNFFGLAAQYCVDAAAVSLTGFPAGGVFTGKGISGSSFNPSIAGVGTHTIRYTYSDGNGCINYDDQQVVINAVPVANFSLRDVCEGSIVKFTDLSVVGNGENITSWKWHFGDALAEEANTSLLQHPQHQYTTAGNYTVSLEVTTAAGCTNSKSMVITIGNIPVPDFTWRSICEGETTLFTHQTNAEFGEISSWTWDFGDGSQQTYTRSSDQVSHQYEQAGKYLVSLTVQSNFTCSATFTKEIYILPSVSAYPYVAGFEGSTQGWVADGSNVSWQQGKPAGAVIHQAASGEHVWMTDLTGNYQSNEHSYVYSPCFNFTTLKRPMISLDIFSHTQKGFDGAVLQASTDGGSSWQNVGGINEGLEWYNQSAIIGNPGEQVIGQIGWSGVDSLWQSAKYALDEFKGHSSVRFRIAFGSNQDNPADVQLDGFAFDNVYIGERDRIVLLEHFTNTGNQEAINENTFINNLSDINNEEAIDIQYHTNFPDIDPLNESNVADPSARALYYGISQTPRTVVDGYMEDKKFSPWGVPVLKRRKLLETPFGIEIDFPASDENMWNISAKVSASLKVENPVFVHIAVIEKQVRDIYEGAPTFENVLRKMLPDAAGTLFTHPWMPGTSETITHSWQPVHVKDASQLAVVVFIQDAQTKEIYQAAIKQPAILPQVITALEDVETLEDGVMLYPNPASNQSKVVFRQPLTADREWVVYDLIGKKISHGVVAKGQQAFVLNTSSYTEGSYLIHISGKGKVPIYKRLLIIHEK
ncbi:PKD domain-containing protein [Rhodocytophaga rosea]|uniref:PKD domain-containing protein n=1 Tax=Rhodocytophaga rosea TaxID=2704465 RepID=A0A6C0GWQ0_9BACT|nr:PKD domain-containing protein [Rhodocytophaga rosea]QHT71730.1 PKD domain-containing protein [Rhodocytophaga rosea]